MELESTGRAADAHAALDAAIEHAEKGFGGTKGV